MLDNLFNLVQKGGPVMIIIILVSLAAFTLIIKKWLFLRKKMADPIFLEEFFARVREKDFVKAKALCQESLSPIAEILALGIDHREKEKERIRDLVHEIVLRELHDLEKYLSTIAVLATILPILGLLGTVTGMISTFEVLSKVGTTDPAALAAGISEALLTTQAGLITALPTLLFHNFLSNKVDQITLDMEAALSRFLNLLE
ncbi:MotA/TolQ/ExbB proton channel family protein [bacterium]|nr:MotA/TolQ/ExbB proton channel family protein [bacterium]MBU1614066.1 MotA/TolQ/ExbB proton channel family protein [bacterium]